MVNQILIIMLIVIATICQQHSRSILTTVHLNTHKQIQITFLIGIHSKELLFSNKKLTSLNIINPLIGEILQNQLMSPNELTPITTKSQTLHQFTPI